MIIFPFIFKHLQSHKVLIIYIVLLILNFNESFNLQRINNQFIQGQYVNSLNLLNDHTKLYANPINSEGSNYRGDITEEEAFLWFDEALIYVRGGSGGAGSNTYRFGKSKQFLGPIGGSGGNGGSVILTSDSSLNTLLQFKGSGSFKAENGNPGDHNFQNGLYGSDCIVYVPIGTIVKDNSTGQVLGELNYQNERLIVAKGGIGGQGNAANKANKGEKNTCTPPEGGEKRFIKLELNLVADIGLVGVPNAGKSTLLDATTNARPKIAAYPFTTIVPNLGVCEMVGQIGQSMVIADIPGLLEGAHLGIGLGRGFLRHVERCKMIIHVVNGDSIDPIGDFKAINRELQLFSPTLAAKPQVVVLNKIDLPHVSLKQKELMLGLQSCMSHSRLMAISAAGRLGTNDLVDKTWKFLNKIKNDEEKNVENKIKTKINEDNVSLKVSYVNNSTVCVSGIAIQAIIDEFRLGDAYYGSIERFEALIEAIGLIDEIYNVFNQHNDYNDDKDIDYTNINNNNIHILKKTVDNRLLKVEFPQTNHDEKFVMYMKNGKFHLNMV